MPCQHSRPLDFMITEKEIRKAAEKLKNNKSPFSDKTRRYGSVYLGVVVLRELYFEHALLQLNNCHHILPDQFQTVAAVLTSDWCQKTFVFFCPIRR